MNKYQSFSLAFSEARLLGFTGGAPRSEPDHSESVDPAPADSFDASETITFDTNSEETGTSADETLVYTKDELQMHLCQLFTLYFDNQGIRRSFNKCCRKWEEKIKPGRMVASLSEFLGGRDKLQNMLSGYVDSIFSSEEFQRGIADYNKMYLYVTNRFKNDLNKIKTLSRTAREDPIYDSSLFTRNKPPGTYINGELLRPSRIYTGLSYNPRSPEAVRRLRRASGMPEDPAHEWAKEKMEEFRHSAFAQGLRERVRRDVIRNGTWTDASEGGELDQLVEAKFEEELERAFRERNERLWQDYQRTLPPLIDIPNPDEPEPGSMESAIDLKYRADVARTVNTALNLSMSTIAGVDDEVTFNVLTDFTPEGREDGEVQIVKFRRNVPNFRGEAVREPEEGLVLVEPYDDPPDAMDIRVVEYKDVDDMLTQLRDPMYVALANYLPPQMQQSIRTLSSTSKEARTDKFYADDMISYLLIQEFPRMTQLLATLRDGGIDSPDKMDSLKRLDTLPDDQISDLRDAVNPAMRRDGVGRWTVVLLALCDGYSINAGEDKVAALSRVLGLPLSAD